MSDHFMYMTRYWQRINAEARDLDPGFRQHLIEVALPHQRAFNAVMKACFGDVAGVEFKAEDRDVWGFICPNIEIKGSNEPWRIQCFDAHGMIGHMCYRQMIDAIEDLARQYPIIDKGALDRVSATQLWSQGLQRQEFRDQYARGAITYKQLMERLAASQKAGIEEGVAA